jgi:hypothetical protein
MEWFTQVSVVIIASAVGRRVCSRCASALLVVRFNGLVIDSAVG